MQASYNCADKCHYVGMLQFCPNFFLTAREAQVALELQYQREQLERLRREQVASTLSRLQQQRKQVAIH